MPGRDSVHRHLCKRQCSQTSPQETISTASKTHITISKSLDPSLNLNRFLKLDVHIVTKVFGDRHAVEVLAPGALGDGADVEEDETQREEPDKKHDAHHHLDALAVAVKLPEADVR